MRIRIALILIFGFLVSASCLRGGEPTNHKAALQGSWKMIEAVFSGKKSSVLQPEILKTKITFSGDKMKMTSPDPDDQQGNREFTFQLFSGKTPNEIDLVSLSGVSKGGKILAIYKLEKDALTLAIPNKIASRPTTFESPKGSDVTVFTLKRI